MSTIRDSHTAPGTFTIASLNLWRFHDWERRLPAILSLLSRLRPDIIFTQETQRDPSVDTRDQAAILNAALGYPYCSFFPADLKYHADDAARQHPIEHGLGILGAVPFSGKAIGLRRDPEDNERRIIVECVADLGGVRQTLVNVHFSNSDRWAEAHFREVLERYRMDPPIVAGDFNIKSITAYRKEYETAFVASADTYEYVSYPADNLSYDYMLLPHRYKFEDFDCYPQYLSDHRLIVATVSPA